MGIFASYQTGGSQTFLNSVINRLPYNYRVIQNLETLNPKYREFHALTARKEELLSRQSVFQYQPEDSGSGQLMVNNDYSRFMYGQIDADKTNRIRDYRRMAIFAELSDCVDEICDEAIVKDENDKIVQFNLRGKHDNVTKEEINKEFNQFINIFDLESRGWEQFRNFLIDGELFFENVLVKQKEKLGILGLVSIPTELINPIYDNVQNSIIKGFLLRKPSIGRKGSAVLTTEEKIIPLAKNQVTYIHSGIWNEDKTVRLPYIEAARRAFKQLSLIEDSIVIYRLVRAPERLVFKVDVGNMAPPKAEAYIKRLMQQYWNKKGFDSATGRITNQYDPQSMLDSYWFAKRTGQDGTTVETLAGGCLAMDTKIPLLDGRTLTLNQLTEEFNAGKENWGYSCDPVTGKVTGGKIEWAGVTQESAPVMKLTFDNDKELVCTLDHKFPTIHKGKVQAKDLKVGDSIFPLNRRTQKITDRSCDYEQIYQHDTKEWNFTHRAIAADFKSHGLITDLILNKEDITSRRGVIHHFNYNRFNNNPSNLRLMTNNDHINLHASTSNSTINENISKGLKKYYAKMPLKKKLQQGLRIANEGKKWRLNLTLEEKQQYAEKMRKSSFQNFITNPKLRDVISSAAKQSWQDPKIWKKRSKGITKKWQDPQWRTKMVRRRGLVCSEDSLKELINIIRNSEYMDSNSEYINNSSEYFPLEHLVKYLNENNTNKFSTQFFKDNKDKIWKGKITTSNLRFFIQQHGYTTYKQFHNESSLYNHKVTKIEYLKDPIQVGTLTISEQHHKHHTFALDCGVFTYNSNLGQLDDLNYFVNKLYKSLKVPVSRLQADDAFRDGTEITREELRFARFVMRVQRQFAIGVRDTFITHLKLREKWQNHKLKEHQINVTFNTPTSFMAMRDQQLFELKQNNFNVMSQNEGMANSYSQRHYLGLTDAQMAENRVWLKKDAALQWEIDQIRTTGPDFREMAAQTDQAIAGVTGGGGSSPPAFGPPPTGAGPEGGETPEGGAAGTIPGGGAPGTTSPTGGTTSGPSALPGAPPT